jgi:hypothetical protein
MDIFGKKSSNVACSSISISIKVHKAEAQRCSPKPPTINTAGFFSGDLELASGILNFECFHCN